MRKCNFMRMKLFLFLGFLLTGVFLLKEQALAAGIIVIDPITVEMVDYEEEEIVINNNGNTRIKFATEVEASKDNWEIMNADPGDTTRIDFSWVSPTMESIIMVKGEYDIDNEHVRRIVLPARTPKLNISINFSNINLLKKDTPIAPLINIMSTAGTGANPITFSDLEWKKGDNGKWKSIDLLKVSQIEKYQIRGADIYFRIKAVNDVVRTDISGNPIYPDGKLGRRVSSEVKLKISKKAPALVVGIDGSRFTADIRYGREYRITDSDGIPTGWIQVTDRTVKNIDLKEILSKIEISADGIKEPFPPMFIEVREYATSKSAASKITEIVLPDPQRVIDESLLVEGRPIISSPLDPSIYVSYNGNKNLVINIPSASASNPYEYCVVKPEEADLDFDVKRVTWTSITKKTDVKVLGSKAVDEGVLYIRQKEIKSKAKTTTSPAVAYSLASTVVSHVIKYPATPVIDKEGFTFVKNINLPENVVEFDITLKSGDREAYENTIKNIKLGTRIIEFDTSLNATGDILTVTLRPASLQALPSAVNKALTITFEKGTTIKNAILLTVKNPTEAFSLTITSEKGAAGKTKTNIINSLGAGNAYCYMITADTMDKKVFIDDFYENHIGLIPFVSGDEITVPEGSYLTIIEYNTFSRQFVKYRSIKINSDILG